MKKFVFILMALIMSASIYAKSGVAVMEYTAGSTTNMGDGVNNASLVGLTADTFYVAAYKNGNTNMPGLNKVDEIRLYAGNVKDPSTIGNGNTIVVSVQDNINITLDSINIIFTENYATGLDTTVTATDFTMQNVNTENKQVRIKQVVIYYSEEKEVPTGIYNTEVVNSGMIYDVTGRQVGSSYHGVVIKGGEKILQ